METPNRPPWWKYLRLRLRTLIVLILLVGTWLGWIVHRATIQRDAVEAIEKARGSVLYDWQWKNGLPNPCGELRWPRWMIDRVGVDYFADVLQARIMDRGSDAEMAHIGRLGRLDTLDLSGSPISDAGLVHLEGLPHLLALALAATRVTDAGLVHLEGLRSLTDLRLNGTKVTDSSVRAIQRVMPKLRIYLTRP